MTRTDDDSWDLATSVGATATMVAAARAIASKDPRSLINDPFAEPLVRAVGIDLFVKLLDGEIDLSQLPSGTIRIEAMVAGMMVRTKFFDDFFIEAGEASVRQAVILASGLDSRAYRLAWPAGTVVYEIDQPEVLEFKSRTLADIGAEPTATRHAVPIDLREDWPTALIAAGFDSSAPTAWSAEGLLIYLPSDAQDRLFDTITELSAVGSVLATHYVPGIRQFDAEKARERTQPLRDLGLEIDLPSLVYTGHRSPVLDYLVERGWHVTGFPRDELFGQYGLEAPSRDESDQIDEVINVRATRV
jgi:methyltransferase (TIGR00027 family)